jgi:4-hydroxybenzoate polyprenyltransferase
MTVSGRPPGALWLFLLLSFANGCLLEIGRKIYAPVNERPGVETYSAVLGARRATLLWCGVLLGALACLLAVGFAVGASRAVGVIGVVACAVCVAGGWKFMRAPGAAGQKRLDTLSGLWVLICYGTAGFTPLALRGWGP